MELFFVLLVVVGLVYLVGVPLSRATPRREQLTLPDPAPSWPPPQGWPPPGSPPQGWSAPSSGWQTPAQPLLPPVTAAEVSSLRDRLGHDVISLQPGADPVARQAMADAAERHATASHLLDRAGSDAQVRTAWLAAVEGLQAARVVRQRVGLDPGPPIPSLPTAGQPLTAHARVEVAGRSHVGAPSYEPGRPHWFPGGSYDGRPVPAGWYERPFWPSALVLGGLTGWALGSLLAGPMYGEDAGLLGGEDLAGGSGGGGDWGGGDWGGGGGDWGGSGGGGDWGGGGGDWSGGDFGGGDFGGGGDW